MTRRMRLVGLILVWFNIICVLANLGFAAWRLLYEWSDYTWLNIANVPTNALLAAFIWWQIRDVAVCE